MGWLSDWNSTLECRRLCSKDSFPCLSFESLHTDKNVPIHLHDSQSSQAHKCTKIDHLCVHSKALLHCMPMYGHIKQSTPWSSVQGTAAHCKFHTQTAACSCLCVANTPGHLHTSIYIPATKTIKSLPFAHYTTTLNKGQKQVPPIHGPIIEQCLILSLHSAKCTCSGILSYVHGWQ